MKRLRIVQGGIENGDKSEIIELATNGKSVNTWVAPKDSQPGDDVVIYIAGYGFFATAAISSLAKPRSDWKNRYGAAISNIKLIEPAISLAAILRHIPDLTWARYPRSITTPDDNTASQIRKLIQHRRKTKLPDIDDDALRDSNLDELRRVAVMKSNSSLPKKQRKSIDRARSLAIRLYVLKRAEGYCEYCEFEAPFMKQDGSPYLESHHTTQLSDDGPDHPSHVIALCPNCHRRAHHADDAESFNSELKELLLELESN